jgi:hypothetical protein
VNTGLSREPGSGSAPGMARLAKSARRAAISVRAIAFSKPCRVGSQAMYKHVALLESASLNEPGLAASLRPQQQQRIASGQRQLRRCDLLRHPHERKLRFHPAPAT